MIDTKFDGLSVLIIGYRRAENISIILNICKNIGITSIYISVDGPKEGVLEGLPDNVKILKVIEVFQKSYRGKLTLNMRSVNVGCAASVLSACDWFFAQTNYGIVLEDDCVPGTDFFNFALNIQEALENNPNIWLGCGTQFIPKEMLQSSPILSKYALTWGWITSSNKWAEIKRSILGNVNILDNSSLLELIESVYWKSGAMRAYKGFTDVWDTILVHRMHQEKKFAILPPENLVNNIGNDFAATHTKEQNSFLNRGFGEYKVHNFELIYSKESNLWIHDNVYRISFRHLITTKITSFVDRFFRVKKFKELTIRWGNSTIS